MVLVWASCQLTDPLLVDLFNSAKRINGNWAALRERQLQNSKPN